MFVSGGMFVLGQLLLCRCFCVLWSVLNLSGGRFGGVKIRIFLCGFFVCVFVCVFVCFLCVFFFVFGLFVSCCCFFCFSWVFLKFCFVIGFVSVYFALFDSMFPLFLFNRISPLSTCRKTKARGKNAEQN